MLYMFWNAGTQPCSARSECTKVRHTRFPSRTTLESARRLQQRAIAQAFDACSLSPGPKAPCRCEANKARTGARRIQQFQAQGACMSIYCRNAGQWSPHAIGHDRVATMRASSRGSEALMVCAGDAFRLTEGLWFLSVLVSLLSDDCNKYVLVTCRLSSIGDLAVQYNHITHLLKNRGDDVKFTRW